MIIRKLDFSNSNEVIEVSKMFRELIKELYKELASTDFYNYFNEVQSWNNENYDVYITINENNTITGFIQGFITCECFTHTHYIAEQVYVKTEYRHTKSAYLLYNTIVKRADELKLTIIGNAYLLNENRADKILGKFGKPIYQQYIKEFNNGRR
jgi:hypothetical protein